MITKTEIKKNHGKGESHSIYKGECAWEFGKLASYYFQFIPKSSSAAGCW